jgi:hypothetical protein
MFAVKRAVYLAPWPYRRATCALSSNKKRLKSQKYPEAPPPPEQVEQEEPSPPPLPTPPGSPTCSGVAASRDCTKAFALLIAPEFGKFGINDRTVEKLLISPSSGEGKPEGKPLEPIKFPVVDPVGT